MKMSPQDKIKLALLAAMLAKSSLDLLALDHASLATMQFGKIVKDLRALDEHLQALHEAEENK